MSERFHAYAWSALSCACLFGLLAQSQADQQVPDAPVVSKVDGSPATVSFKDGRVATLMVAALPPSLLPVPVGIEESTCNIPAGMTCELRFGFRISDFAMQWSTHPRPDKIGATLTFASAGGNREKVSSNAFVLFDNWISKPNLVKALPKSEIVCSDYSWLPGGTRKAAAAETRIERWESEEMTRNPETDMDENRTLGGASEIKLVRAADGRLLIDSMQDLISKGSGSELLNGSIYTLTFRLADGELCQISAKPNLTAAVGALNKYLANLPERYSPYLWGSDDFSMDSSVAYLFEQMSRTDYMGTDANNQNIYKAREFE